MEKVVPKTELGRLVDLLLERGYRVVAPVLKEGVIFFEEVGSFSQVARCVTEEQDRGHYRVGKAEEWFGYVHGPNSLKHFLHPPKTDLLKIKPDLSQEVPIERKRYAFFGVRGCDIASLRILDKVFLGDFRDPYYAGLREGTFTVAFNCTRPSRTCFCASIGTGPFVRDGSDLIITELKNSFLVRATTDEGKDVLEKLDGREPEQRDYDEERDLEERSLSAMVRRVNIRDLPSKLLEKLESDVWEDVARRCLACGSCAMVCPTCFCYEVVDDITLDGSASVRFRRWDVCFREEFSAIHGSPIRKSVASRYRQWLLHKFSYWVDQFGELGCVGCGRCITWCPVGIDITEEVKRLLSDG